MQLGSNNIVNTVVSDYGAEVTPYPRLSHALTLYEPQLPLEVHTYKPRRLTRVASMSNCMRHTSNDMSAWALPITRAPPA